MIRSARVVNERAGTLTCSAARSALSKGYQARLSEAGPQVPPRRQQGTGCRGAVQGGHRSAPPGDLYLKIEFSPHPRFRVDGRDVYLELPVAPWEAALGANVTVPTPDGSVELAVPPRPGGLPRDGANLERIRSASLD